MNNTNKIRLLVISAVLLFWLSHWLGANIPEKGIDTPWIIVGIIIMLIKTLPLWIFVFMVKPNAVKINQYLSFSAIFYALLSFWNMFGEFWIMGLLQFLTTSYLLWILTMMGRKTKKAFKESKKKE